MLNTVIVIVKSSFYDGVAAYFFTLSLKYKKTDYNTSNVYKPN